MYMLMWPWLGPPLTTIRYVLPVSWRRHVPITGQAMAMSIGRIQIMLSKTILECGPMPNLVVALPNI